MRSRKIQTHMLLVKVRWCSHCRKQFNGSSQVSLDHGREQPEAVGGRLCRNKRVGCLGSHTRLWLDCLTNSAGWQGNEICCLGVSTIVPGLLDKEDCLTRGPYLWTQSREENVHLGHVRASWFQVSRQQVILFPSLILHRFTTRKEILLFPLVTIIQLSLSQIMYLPLKMGV